MTDARLPITQELALEVLAARHRLGETIWTFDSRTRPALRALAERGLVTVLSPLVEHTVRASLTAAGRAHALGAAYRPPSRPLTHAQVRRALLDATWPDGSPVDHLTPKTAVYLADAVIAAQEARP